MDSLGGKVIIVTKASHCLAAPAKPRGTVVRKTRDRRLTEDRFGHVLSPPNDPCHARLRLV
jgi:hypothetical protein